jgi:hypothetical protein
MSKPDRPGELRGVTVEAISLVSKAANGEKFKIFKSAKPEEKEAPEVVEKDERGLFHILKEFFTGTSKPVEKGDVSDVYHAKKAGGKLHEAFEALMNVLGLSRWDDENRTPETDPAKILAALDDFRNIAIEITIGSSEVEKSGRKISGDRLGKLKNIQAMLTEVLSGLEENEDTLKEAEDSTKEEVQKAVSDAVAPIIERIEKIENARGFSNRVPEDSSVQKGANDFWGGIF